MLTSSPNRKSLGEVASFIEGKAEAYRVWCVLIRHWLDLNEESEQRAAAASTAPPVRVDPSGSSINALVEIEHDAPRSQASIPSVLTIALSARESA